MQNKLTRQIIDIINWNEFFHFWKFKGKYPEILRNEEAKKLFDEANELLKKLQNENFYCGEAKIEFFNAKAENDNVIIFADEEIAVRCLRQQTKKPDGEPYFCLADFICEDEKIGVFALTSGGEFEKRTREFAEKDNLHSSLLYASLSQRIVEAFSKYYHNQYLNGKNGICAAVGYPSLPDLRIIRIVDKILNLKSIGITLNENCMMSPLSSVCGFYITHPKIKYFSVGKVAEDQLLDYAKRGNETVEEVKKWLN
jgi:5-methyltetrahydrofolate--homocysteine methyltransferase